MKSLLFTEENKNVKQNPRFQVRGVSHLLAVVGSRGDMKQQEEASPEYIAMKKEASYEVGIPSVVIC